MATNTRPHTAPLSKLTCGPYPPDDQILVELGSAEDYDGVQKSRFIQGLRELLQDFRVKKVKDFDTIASGIIGYRARFLEDRSKILHLDGVTL